MGKRFLRSIVSDFQTLTASADITPIDLPTNPLSALYLTLLATKNVAADVTNLGRVLIPIVQQITDLSVRQNGENVIQGRLDDLAVIQALLHGQLPAVREFEYADNQVQAVTIPLAFGRRPFDPLEGLPPATRGTLRFHLTAGALPTGYDAVRWGLEAVELIEDTPTRHLKYTTISKAIAATGRQRIDLPIGRDLLGILLFDPSDEADDTMEYVFGKIKLLKDNVEQYFAECNWETLAETLERRVPLWRLAWGHQHGQAAADTDTGEETVKIADRAPLQYGYLDFDPLNDLMYVCETRGASQLQIDHSADVGSGTARIIPIEVIPHAA